jgi:hypothetical protein
MFAFKIFLQNSPLNSVEIDETAQQDIRFGGQGTRGDPEMETPLSE